jgi:hypothetical protein
MIAGHRFAGEGAPLAHRNGRRESQERILDMANLVNQVARDRMSRFAANFWEAPAVVSMRLVAVTLVVMAVIGVPLDALEIGGRLRMHPVTAMLVFLAAWALSAKDEQGNNRSLLICGIRSEYRSPHTSG